MLATTRAGRRISAFALAVLLAALSVAVPLLDRDPGSATAVLTSPDAPRGSALGHDHGICTQYGANPWASAAVPQTRDRTVVRTFTGPDGVTHCDRPSLYSVHQSRAPPAV